MRLNRRAGAPSYSDFYSARNDLEYFNVSNVVMLRISLASRASDRMRLESATHVLLVIVISTLLEMI